jgi:hypothetical protein
MPARLGLLLLLAVLGLVGCGDGTGDTDAGPTTDGGGGMDAASDDAGMGVDSGPADAGPGVDAGPGDDGGSTDDAGPGVDAGPVCGGNLPGSCAATPGTTCLSCPAGGPAEHYLCTTACTSDAQCTDAARPRCNRPSGGPGVGGAGICTPDTFACAWGAVCASPDTAIDTPKGERPIAELVPGDLVLTQHQGALVARPLVAVHRTAVQGHAVVRLVLASGRILEISGGHPTADGRLFSDLAPGDALDGVAIRAVSSVPYAHPFTHDILPDSNTGTYVAGGVLIGSTLFEE